MMQVLEDTAHLSAKELLNLSPKEAALLEALRGLFEAIEFPKLENSPFGSVAIQPTMMTAIVPNPDEETSAFIRQKNHKHFIRAKEVYLKLRDLSHAGPAKL